jgi:hypothetical protein
MSASERATAAKKELDKESSKSLGECLVDSSKSEISSLSIQAIPESPTVVPVGQRKLSSSQEEYFQDFNSAKVVADYVSELLRNGMKDVAVMVIDEESKEKEKEKEKGIENMTDKKSKEIQLKSPEQKKNKESGDSRDFFNGNVFVSDCVNTAKSNVAHRRASDEDKLSEFSLETEKNSH